MRTLLSKFSSGKTNWEKMPQFLKSLAAACFLGGLFVVGVAFLSPFVEFGGKELTREEFWSSGYGPSVVLLGLLMIIAGFGLLTRRAWSRWLVLVLLMVASIGVGRVGDFEIQLPAIVGGVITYWYLFCKHSVRQYFVQVAQETAVKEKGSTLDN